jgi:hypothetical protein
MSKIEKASNLMLTAGGIIAGGYFFVNSFFYTVDAGNSYDD